MVDINWDAEGIDTSPFGETLSTRCTHDYVNVGFSAIKMACKHCNEEQS